MPLSPVLCSCFVCGTRGCTVFLDTHTTTLREFIDKVLKGALNFNSPSIDNGREFVFLEEREEDEDDDDYEQKLSFLTRPLSGLVGGGLGDGIIAAVTDFSQDLKLQLTVRHRAKEDFDELKHPQFFELAGDVEAVAVEKKLEAEALEARKGTGAGEGPKSGTSASASASASAAAATAAAAARTKRPREAGVPPAPEGVLDLVEDEEERNGGGGGEGGTSKRARSSAAAEAPSGCACQPSSTGAQQATTVIVIDEDD
jgi:hypothetical protein